jgi:hypothetical protein
MTDVSVRHLVVDEADWFDVAAALTSADIALVEVSGFGEHHLPRRYTALFCRKEIPGNDLNLEDLRRLAAWVETIESWAAFALKGVLLITALTIACS